MPLEKIKFLEEQSLIIFENKERLEKQLSQINKDQAESEPRNKSLQQKLITLNELETAINVRSTADFKSIQSFLFIIF